MLISRRLLSNVQRKRFYNSVDTVAVTGGWSVSLDAKVIKTPARESLILPTQLLAWGVANEFDSQKDLVVPATMPLMTIASTAIDVTRTNRSPAIERITKYLETDTVSFLHEDEVELQALQREKWDPIREWAKVTCGISTNQVAGISLQPGQCELGLHALSSELDSLDFWRLTTMEIAAASAKSALIALALLRGRFTVDDALSAALVEEKWQRSNWGTVEGCHDISERETAMWLAACSFFESALVSS